MVFFFYKLQGIILFYSFKKKKIDIFQHEMYRNRILISTFNTINNSIYNQY